MDEQRYRHAEERLWAEEGVTPTERFVRLPRRAVRVRVQEVGEGPPVLFVHGNPSAGSTWAPLAARLRGLRCILLDRPGTGLSDAHEWRRDTVGEDFDGLVADVLDALEIERAHLVGSSTGSDFVLRAGVRHPSRVLRTVHFGCPGFAPGIRVPLSQRLFCQPGLWRLAAKMMPVSEKGMRSMMKHLGHAAALEDGRISEPMLAWFSALYRHTPTLSHEMRLASAMLSLRGFHPWLVMTAEDLAAIESPTCFFWGDDDVFGDASIARGMDEHMPDVHIEALPKGGHLPWLDDPERAAATTQRHLLLHGEARLSLSA